ncbi:hypothetical protein KKF38_03305 [Patescibacteria group bacterium]|nr:hypothetical protein [Patescibacteria group bacterium]
MKLKEAPHLKQTSLFPTENNLVDDLSKKFPNIPRLQIQQMLRETKFILEKKTDGNYSHRQLMYWTGIILQDLQHPKKRSEIVKLSRKPSRKVVSRVLGHKPDYKSAAANDDTFND